MSLLADPSSSWQQLAATHSPDVGPLGQGLVCSWGLWEPLLPLQRVSLAFSTPALCQLSSRLYSLPPWARGQAGA